ncbi:MAG: PPC domain-containing DNA-binding protein [Elusimicrobiota bacterium]
MFKKAKLGRTFIGRFEYGDDLLESLNGFCRKRKIKAGFFNLIGAVQNAKLGYYSQSEKKYTGCVEINKKLEIASCMGNVSIKEGEIFVHAHIVLADYTGKASGGHLMPGTKVFAAEYVIQELKNGKLVRVKDSVTGLPLWK